MQKFSATIEIIDINPYVEVPGKILKVLQKEANREKGAIPVKGTLQGKLYKQTVVKFRRLWRLYLNTSMRLASKTDVGDTVTIEIEYDPEPRTVEMPKQFVEALKENKIAKAAFAKLPPSRQKEINRYLSSLKTEETIHRNIEKITRFLTGRKTDGVLFR